MQKETLHILQTVMKQNYFQVGQEYYIQVQTDGLAMVASTS
jgi:hypothetical protein